MTDYQPGTVAEIEVNLNGREWEFRTALLSEDRWRFADGLAWGTAVRRVWPLVALKLAEGEAKELADFLQGVDMHLSVGDRLQIARQIRQQAKPARIPEPGPWGGVVRGKYKDRGEQTFIRVSSSGHGAEWVDTSGRYCYWSDIEDPVLVREGVEG